MNRGQLPDVTRRVFLNRTLLALGAAATLPLATTQAIGSPSGDPEPEPDIPPLEFLNAAEFATLDALAETLIPHGGAFPLGAGDVDLARRIDRYLPTLDPSVAVGFRGALAFVETKAPALAGMPAPFSALSEKDRETVLDAMIQQPGLARGVFTATKYVCMVHFYTIDDTWVFTGYDGPMLLEDMK